jgi:hypothetical protein
MYIDRFINNKYIALMRYCININKGNSIIVNFKYDARNKILFLRSVGKNNNFNAIHLRKFLLRLRKSNKVIFNKKFSIYLHKIKIKKKLMRYLKFLDKKRIPFKYKQLIKTRLIKILNYKLKQFKKNQYKEGIYNKVWFYNFINANTNLYKRFKKIKLLRFIVHKLLHYQVMGNVTLLDGFLGLNLHPLFFKRFKFHFLIFIKNEKLRKTYNFNKFNLSFIYKIYPKMLKFGNLILYLSKLRKLNRFFNSLYLNIASKLASLLTLDVSSKYLNKFRYYMENSNNINYTRVSFKLRGFKKRHWRKKRRFLKKFKRMNFLIFFNLAFFKLVTFLFLYWLNNLIILFNRKSNGIILSGWFKSIGFVFKQYI